MQAIKYAAMASRFTIETLTAVKRRAWFRCFGHSLAWFNLRPSWSPLPDQPADRSVPADAGRASPQIDRPAGRCSWRAGGRPGPPGRGAFEKTLVPCGSCPGMSTSRPRGTASLTERALLLAAKHDYPHALDELLARYEPLIGAIVASLRLPCGCERADVAQEARLGLARAVSAWQPARGPFRAFAARCARNRALRALDAAGARKHQFLSRACSLEDHQPRASARVSLVETAVPARDALEPGESVFHVPLGEQLVSTSAGADPLRTVIAREQLDAVLAGLPGPHSSAWSSPQP
jgi:RNA polymerase sigma factor (sigma-70 family)